MHEHDSHSDWRALLVALALLILIAPLTFQVAVARMPIEVFFGFGAGVPAMLPLTVLLASAALASAGLFRRFGAKRRQLMIVYMVLLVGVPLLSRGVLFYIIPKVTWLYYMAALRPDYAATFIQYLPGWWGSGDPAVLEGFLYGGRVPWAAWAAPLAAWGSFMLALWLSVSCLIILLRRQWILHERLTFPVAQIPLEMVREAVDPSGRARVTAGAGRMFWLGALVSFAITFIHSISARIPGVPYLPLVFVLVPAATSGPLSGMGEIRVALPPVIIGLLYLLPKDILFSAWFLWLIHLAINVVSIAAGFTVQEGSLQQRFLPAEYQGLGCAFALTFWVFWTGRSHLVRVVRMAVSRHTDPEAARDASAYRWAFLGLAASFGWMTWFCVLSGCRTTVALVFIGLIVGYFLYWARLRAETGLGFLSYPMDIAFLMTGPFGSAIYRPQEVVTFITMRWATFVGGGETLEVCSGNALECYKIADATGINWRRASAVIGVGFVVALIAGIYATMTGIYAHGITNTDAGSGFFWPALYSRTDAEMIYSTLTNPAPAHGMNSIAAIIVGAAIALALGLLRLRFWWWPLHPVGYLLTTSYGMIFLLFPFLIAWVAKVLVVRYGGLRLYRQTVPLAVGLIIGDLLNVAIWSLVTQFSSLHSPTEWWW